MEYFISSAFILGLSAGLSPGPLFLLTVSETIKSGFKNGCKIAIAPIFTDLPIILISTFVLIQLSDLKIVISIISIFGSLFLLYLGYKSIVYKGDDIENNVASLKKGIVTNLLNPNVYVFWFTIGSPIILKAYKINMSHSIIFVILFFANLIGSKIIIALIVQQTKQKLNGRVLKYIQTILGVVLIIFAIMILYDTYQYITK